MAESASLIVIVDYGVGNVGSILNMMQRTGLGRTEISSDPRKILDADKLILPGVGAFDNGMRKLRKSGLVEHLTHTVVERGTPILGICLGMQMFTRGSEEGSHEGLGWIDAVTVRIHGTDIRVPHMGWNRVIFRAASPMTKGLDDDARFYFVHSYYVEPSSPSTVLGTTTYGQTFASAIQEGNIVGVQFHPEKSHLFGLALLRNFAAMPRHL